MNDDDAKGNDYAATQQGGAEVRSGNVAKTGSKSI